MVNNDDFQVDYTTVADQTVQYPIPFKYYSDPITGVPELIVNLDGNGLTYQTDYTLSPAGLQLTTAPAAGLTLVIFRNPPFEQAIDFQTGLIDPEQIEHAFDESVMRDIYLKGYADWIFQNASDAFDALAQVAWSGSYNDLTDTPTIPTVGNGTITLRQGGVSKGTFTTNQSGNTTIDLDGGLVTSVNGYTGTVVLTASDVGAVAPGDLATVATTGSYTDLSDKPAIPTVGAGLITINQGGVLKGSFNVNQMGTTTIDLDAGGGGAAFPTQTGHAGEFLKTDGSDVSWDIATSVTFRVWGANE